MQNAVTYTYILSAFTRAFCRLLYFGDAWLPMYFRTVQAVAQEWPVRASDNGSRRKPSSCVAALIHPTSIPIQTNESNISSIEPGSMRLVYRSYHSGSQNFLSTNVAASWLLAIISLRTYVHRPNYCCSICCMSYFWT